MHPDFHLAAIRGEFGSKASLREAFVEELGVINTMCKEIGWPPLFRHAPDEAPRDLAFLILPTADEFNSFVHTLDKLMSENINQRFFPESIPREVEETREDGRVLTRVRGTLQLLEEWLLRHFRVDNPEPLRECLATFRKVRKLRQKPAHAIVRDEYDATLFEGQRNLFHEAYSAMRTIRLLLQNLPGTSRVIAEMDECVREGRIWLR